MNPETFILRKQFLEEFYNKDRIKFFKTCRDIEIFNSHINRPIYRNFFFSTVPIFSSGKNYLSKTFFKTFSNLVKPFIYFLYSITYYNNFFRGKILFFDKLEIRCRKYTDEMVSDTSSYFVIHNNKDLSSPNEDFNFLEFIKINELLNESADRLKYVYVELTTKYIYIDRFEFNSLLGYDVDETGYTNIEGTRILSGIINSSQTFKSEECVICLTNPPQVLFCNCGHLCYCSECEKLKTSNKCPICKTENEIIRMLE